jgi:catechol 2,3-dioxygenase-like lactoylglutathione lyase family enzyme
MKAVLDHIGLNVEDVTTAVDFYERVLGFEIERFEEFEKGFVPFPSVRINRDSVIDLFPPKVWKQDGGEGNAGNSDLNHFCLTFEVAEWKKLIDRIKQNNVEIIRYADNNWGARGIGISVYFCDPDGHEIEARYYQR